MAAVSSVANENSSKFIVIILLVSHHISLSWKIAPVRTLVTRSFTFWLDGYSGFLPGDVFEMNG